jgi:hypothetical protein
VRSLAVPHPAGEGGSLPSKLRRHAFFGLEQTQPPDLGLSLPHGK